MLRKTITIIYCMTMFASATVPVAQAKHSDDRPGFFQRHKRLKKVLLIGGVGAATGGAGAVLLGHSVAAGAATGAGTRLGMHAAKEKYKEHKNRKP